MWVIENMISIVFSVLILTGRCKVRYESQKSGAG